MSVIEFIQLRRRFSSGLFDSRAQRLIQVRNVQISAVIRVALCEEMWDPSMLREQSVCRKLRIVAIKDLS